MIVKRAENVSEIVHLLEKSGDNDNSWVKVVTQPHRIIFDLTVKLEPV